MILRLPKVAVCRHRDLPLHIGAFGSQPVPGFMRLIPDGGYPVPGSTCVLKPRSATPQCLFGGHCSEPSIEPDLPKAPVSAAAPVVSTAGVAGDAPPWHVPRRSAAASGAGRMLTIFCPVISKLKETLRLVVCLIHADWFGLKKMVRCDTGLAFQRRAVRMRAVWCTAGDTFQATDSKRQTSTIIKPV